MAIIEYYSFVKVKEITIENIKAHIRKFETLDFACSFPNTDVVIVKESLRGRDAIGSGFFYPNVYSYKLYSTNRNPYYLNYKDNKVSEYIFTTLRSGYYDDKGYCGVNVLDCNEKGREILIKAGFNNDADFIINVITYLIEFEQEYNSDWKIYDLSEKLHETEEEYEKEIEELKDEISELTEKIKKEKIKNKDLRIKMKQTNLKGKTKA